MIEIRELKDKADSDETSDYVELGLDTLHYRFEQGNLKVVQQFEHWVGLVKKQNCAGVLMPGELY